MLVHADSIYEISDLIILFDRIDVYLESKLLELINGMLAP